MRLGEGDVDLMVARDELVMAERAVALLEAEHAERLRDVEALDAPLTAAWTRFTGTRETRIEAAVAAVRNTQLRLEAARRLLERARTSAVGVEDEVERKKFEAVAAQEARVRRLDELESGGGELGAQISALRLERDLLRERGAVIDEAAFAGSDLLAALNTVVGANRRVERMSMSRRRTGGNDPLLQLDAELSKVTDYGIAREGIAAVPRCSERFGVAMAALGRAYTPETPGSTTTVSPLVSLLVNNPLAELAFADHAALQADEYGDLAAQVREQLIPIDRERRDLAARLAELDATLEALAS